MELRTAEVRWFQRGRCPAAVREWFESGPYPGDRERRTDEYLVLPGRDDLGVKRRGGILLDIKLRTGAGGDLAIGDVAGRVELWVKWTFPLGDGLPRSMGEGWTAVTKYRHSRRYELAADGTARSVSGTGIVVDGCAAELVELKVGRNRAWGFGFEAFGSRREPFTVLHAAAEAFLRESPLDGLRFDPVDARGYPGWLQEWPDGRPH